MLILFPFYFLILLFLFFCFTKLLLLLFYIVNIFLLKITFKSPQDAMFAEFASQSCVLRVGLCYEGSFLTFSTQPHMKPKVRFAHKT